MNLNIIGNGFDLYHGLPSSYYHFSCYLIDNDDEFYHELGNRYNIRTMQSVGPTIAHNYKPYVENIFWSDFEKHLGNVHEYSILETSLDDLGLEHDDPTDIEMYDHLAAKKIIKKFVSWVADTLDLTENYSLINTYMSQKSRLQSLNKDDRYITFNYTHTLQNIYNIPNSNIHYVHGECTGSQEDELVVGHGNYNRIFELKEIIEKRKNEYNYTQASYNRINEYQSLLKFYELLCKNIGLCMKDCEIFYKTITNEIDLIKVYGLSMGDVDIPYLIKIRQLWPDAGWKFSYFNSSSIERINEIATNILKLRQDQFSVFEFRNKEATDIQKHIIKGVGLKLY